MRIALIADIHSNILALEAVMKAVKKHSPDMILSLGDQVNLGPCPRECALSRPCLQFVSFPSGRSLGCQG